MITLGKVSVETKGQKVSPISESAQHRQFLTA
jgi:hypothetical protein